MIHGLKCKTLCGRNVHLFSLRMWKRSPCLLVASSLKKKFSPCRPTACCSPQAPPPRPPAWCAPRRSRIRLWWWSPFQFWNLGQFSCHFISSDLPPPPMRQWQMRMWWQKSEKWNDDPQKPLIWAHHLLVFSVSQPGEPQQAGAAPDNNLSQMLVKF